MKMDSFPKVYQRKRTARKRRTIYTQVPSSSSPAGNKIDKRHLRVISDLLLCEKTDYVLVTEERKFIDTSSSLLCFPRGRRSNAKVALNRTVLTSHMAGVSAEGISKECPCPTSSIACGPRGPAPQKGRKRKTKPKDECDFEVTVPQRVHLRGQARRDRNNCNTITNERGKLDSTTFLHHFMHIWGALPEEKVNSVTYFDPLWFQLYANENNRAKVLKWIKGKGVFSKKYVLVPIVLWSHWSLLIFCNLGENVHSKTNTPCMLLLDSMHVIGPTRLEPLIRRLLFDMHISEEKPESKEQLKKMRLLIPKVPQQKKGEECGFYVLYYINLFLAYAPKDFDISEGYPYFMKKDWFTDEGVEAFCKSLDANPFVLSDHNDDSSDCVELIETLSSSTVKIR